MRAPPKMECEATCTCLTIPLRALPYDGTSATEQPERSLRGRKPIMPSLALNRPVASSAIRMHFKALTGPTALCERDPAHPIGPISALFLSLFTLPQQHWPFFRPVTKCWMPSHCRAFAFAVPSAEDPFPSIPVSRDALSVHQLYQITLFYLPHGSYSPPESTVSIYSRTDFLTPLGCLLWVHKLQTQSPITRRWVTG